MSTGVLEYDFPHDAIRQHSLSCIRAVMHVNFTSTPRGK
jgi:hypothetical protein